MGDRLDDPIDSDVSVNKRRIHRDKQTREDHPQRRERANEAIGDETEELLVVNLARPEITLLELVEDAAQSLQNLDTYKFGGRCQEQFKTIDGRWWIVTFKASLQQVDCPTCDACADDLSPETIGSEGPHGVLCRRCLRGNR